jgi:hypothetical protein
MVCIRVFINSVGQYTELSATPVNTAAVMKIAGVGSCPAGVSIRCNGKANSVTHSARYSGADLASRYRAPNVEQSVSKYRTRHCTTACFKAQYHKHDVHLITKQR